MSLVNDVIKKMEGEIGYHEKMSPKNLDDKTANSGNGNYTKYARDLWQKTKTEIVNGNKQGYSWCAVFLITIFYYVLGDSARVRKALRIPSKNSAAAGVPYLYNYFKNANAIYKSPKVGDLIFFSGHSHVGFVVGVSSSKVTTIEGNSANEVRKKTYALTSKDIDGYGRPNYSAVEPKPDPEPQPTPKKKVVKATQKPKSTSAKYSHTYIVNTVKDPLRMRNGASTDYSVMISIPKGKEVYCKGEYTGSWLYVKYETTDTIYEGFVYKTYLKVK